ncbi:UNVERIFIED_CONTAM: hypothetical protein GTU68_059865 [Idotea baltica]|nr:hypothetical protein [Idotea baltica]
MTANVQEGAKAPSFKIETTQGARKLSDYKGKYLVLYFYPKDDTPGCTNEAKNFSELSESFSEANAEVLGVSKDTLAKHEKFIAKHDLNVTLASDENGALCEAFGVWVEKNMYGRKYMGIQRATFLIDPKGVIQTIWPKVKVKGHADAVLGAIGG